MNQAVVALAAGTGVLSLAPIFVRFSPVGPTATGAYRCLMAVPLLALYLWVRRERLLPRTVSAQYWGAVVGAGAAFAVDLTLWHRAIHYAGAGLATVIANTQVFFVAAIGILFMGEKADRRFWASICVAFAGMALLVWRGDSAAVTGSQYPLGVAMGLCAAFAYAVFIVALRKSGSVARAGSSGQRLLAVSFVSGSLMGLWALFEGALTWPGADRLGPLFGLAALPQVLGWLILTAYLPRVRVGVAGLVLLLQPVLSVFLSRWIFGEAFQPHQVAGAALTLFGVYLGTTRRAR